MSVLDRRTIDDVLASARERLTRPYRARDAWDAGAVVVDIRPQAQRVAEGELPGALVIERNVLEWRFDPACDARLPIAAYDLRVIVLCQEGYTSSLAAAALQDLGIEQATDVIGGYRRLARRLPHRHRRMSHKFPMLHGNCPFRGFLWREPVSHATWGTGSSSEWFRCPRRSAGRRPAG